LVQGGKNRLKLNKDSGEAQRTYTQFLYIPAVAFQTAAGAEEENLAV